MSKAINGMEFLERMREQSGKERLTFDAFSSYLENRAREQGVPLDGTLELTPLCNLNCRMCYVHLKEDQMNGRKLLSTDQWKDLIFQAFQAGMIRATLTGGECLTYPGFKEIFLYLHSLGCEVSILTNGVLLDQDWIDFFKQHTPAKIRVTLYGDSEETYKNVTGSPVFTRVTEHIRMMKEADLPVTLSITPSLYLGENVFGTVQKAHDLCRNITINSNLFTPKEETGRAGQDDDVDVDMYIRIFQKMAALNGKELQKIDEQLLPEPGYPADIPEKEICDGSADENTLDEDACSRSKNQNLCGLLCGAGRSSFTIDWKGCMVPCSMMDMIKSYPLRDGFDYAWKEINQAANHWPRPAGCVDCAYQSVCNNCAAYMQQFAEPGKRPEELCLHTKKLVSSGVFRIPDCK